jgi:PTH1 family peptidyl-tRNA hydrolase
MLPASWGTGIIEGRRVSLLKPLAFMNRSGEAVSEILGYFGISAAQMLVIHDDLDLPFGRVRLVQRGGAGGHRGVTSIIEHLGHQDFPRMKLGIGRPEHGEPIEAYVLDSPYKEQEQSFERMIDQAVEAAQMVLSSGLVAAMNRFNRREPQAEDFF